MYKYSFFIALLFLFSCKTASYYIVRHAEKQTTSGMTSDVPLSEEGKQRAFALRDLLKDKHIKVIYSTDFIRTKATAQPLAEAVGIAIQTYDARDTGLIQRLKASNRGNVLIVGHSNTVDDLVNQFMGRTVVSGDLMDSQYGDLFIIRKKNAKLKFEREHFGK